jgi:hypothetical protein
MIAPAWPMRRPGGAVCPATKLTTGFFTFFLMNSAAIFLGIPADFADHHDRVRVGIVVQHACTTSRKDVPMIGSPPMPTHVD